MEHLEVLIEKITELKSPKFKNDKIVARTAFELMDIYINIFDAKTLSRKLRKRIKKVFKHVPYTIYADCGISSTLTAEHIKMICVS